MASTYAAFEGEARPLEYEFVSERAATACQKYGVKSISLAARKRA